MRMLNDALLKAKGRHKKPTGISGGKLGKFLLINFMSFLLRTLCGDHMRLDIQNNNIINHKM
jgi:hypothetical protein